VIGGRLNDAVALIFEPSAKRRILQTEQIGTSVIGALLPLAPGATIGRSCPIVLKKAALAAV
jgi:hypothetical protein